MKEENAVEDKKVRVELFIDPKETGYRKRYQIMEAMIFGFYLLWPVPVLMFLHYLDFHAVATIITIFSIILIYMITLRNIYLLTITKERDTRLNKKGSLFFYDKFLFSENPALREIRQYSALSRSLDVIYNFFRRFEVNPHYFDKNNYVPYPNSKIGHKRLINLFVKKWSEFWIGMPIAQDVRTRVQILADEYFKFIMKLSSEKPGLKINILEVAGGQLQCVIMGIRKAKEEGANFDYQVVSIEPDEEFAKSRAIELISLYNLEVENFFFIASRISTKDNNSEMFIENILKTNGFDTSLFHIVSSVGLGDYYYTTERIKGLLTHLKNGGKSKVMVANISGNIVERLMLHISIQWPPMKYRSLSTWKKIVSSVFCGSRIRIIQTPHKIFNIAVVE